MTQFQIKETFSEPRAASIDLKEKTRPDQLVRTRPCGHRLTQDTVFPTDLERTTDNIWRPRLARAGCATYLYATEKSYHTRSTRSALHFLHLTRSSRASLYLSEVEGSDRGERAAPNKRGRRPFARIPAETTRGA